MKLLDTKESFIVVREHNRDCMDIVRLLQHFSNIGNPRGYCGTNCQDMGVLYDSKKNTYTLTYENAFPMHQVIKTITVNELRILIDNEKFSKSELFPIY